MPILPRFLKQSASYLYQTKRILGISGLDESVKYLLLLSTYDGLVDYVTLVY